MKNTINLFPEQLLRKKQWKELMVWWVGAFILFSIVMLGWLHLQSSQLKASAEHLYFIESQTGPIQFMKRKNGWMTKEIEFLAQENSSQSQPRNSLGVLVAKVIGCVQSSTQNLSVEKICMGGAPEEKNTIRISGIAMSHQAIDQFVTRLESEEIFFQVDVNSDANFEIDGIAVKKYEVVCTF
ncbi:MAG: PilN domain-containing protein [Planctomycetota bacterium]|nr:PilN domain-containing protein [Planctomycetota bacterium]